MARAVGILLEPSFMRRTKAELGAWAHCVALAGAHAKGENPRRGVGVLPYDVHARWMKRRGGEEAQ